AVRAQLRAATAEPAEPADDPFGTDGPAVRAELRRLYVHPTSDELVAMDSTARAFPPALRRFLTWRDTTCRGPHCNAAIRQGDHIEPVSRGGPTSGDNGQGLCAHCNQKGTSAASVRRVENPEGSGTEDRTTDDVQPESEVTSLYVRRGRTPTLGFWVALAIVAPAVAALLSAPLFDFADLSGVLNFMLVAAVFVGLPLAAIAALVDAIRHSGEGRQRR
ncbi:MAG: HNH endonuclease, partial [Brachybacterium sp.]|nr:HNH endonuclease [Brachybacterium sp.]